MVAIAYALGFFVLIGWLALDAQTPWLKVIGYIMSGYMLLAAIIAAVKSEDD